MSDDVVELPALVKPDVGPLGLSPYALKNGSDEKLEETYSGLRARLLVLNERRRILEAAEQRLKRQRHAKRKTAEVSRLLTENYRRSKHTRFAISQAVAEIGSREVSGG
jgi:hypothetical protein